MFKSGQQRESTSNSINRRFASPQGVLGQYFYNPLDASQERAIFDVDTWAHWQTANNFMLSTETYGQSWAVQFSCQIRSNIIWLSENSLPRTRFDTTLEILASAVLFLFEGPLFGPSGIAQVRLLHISYLSK